MKPARNALQLETLETRDAPANVQTQTFDTTPPGSVPAAWSRWTSAPSATVAASTSQPYQGTAGLAAAANPAGTARAWQTTPAVPDTAVSAMVFTDSLNPMQVIARGQNFSGTSPTYYAASLTRGVSVQLIRVINGTATVLGTVQSTNYVSYQWLKLTLRPVGNQIGVELFNPVTGQYLSSAGQWQTQPAVAVSATDGAITGIGLVGLNRPAVYAGTIKADNFATETPDVPTVPPRDRLIPRHYSHIRIAQLAYAGTPYTSTEQQLLQNSVDLVIPNPSFLSQFESVAPNTPKLLYTNVSNLYEGLLTDWLNTADARGLPRENAFYHTTQPTAFTGNSPSSAPVKWFWSVRRDQTDLTSAARNATAGDVAFGGGVGSSLYIGYPDRFREVNATLSAPAAGAWTATLEYVSSVSNTGAPVQWRPLTALANGTNGWRQSGLVAFNPPPDWIAASINGSARLFYIRVRTTAAGNAPVATSLYGRDYVQANGTSAGTIPAFDAASDANHDGYLNDAEFANRAANKNARFYYESRVFYPPYGQMRFVTNPSGLGVSGWASDYLRRTVNANPLSDGVFVDNSAGKLPIPGTATVESTAAYTTDYANILGAAGQAISPRFIMANTSGGNAGTTQVVQKVTAAMEEFALRPLAANYVNFYDMSGLVSARLAASNSPYLVLDSLSNGGSPTDPRTQLATLAYYYLVADPKRTFLMFYGGAEPATSWTRHWSPAAAYNVGQPQGAWSEFASGPDPANATLTYKVFRRNYTNAMVLYKPLSYKLGTGNGTLAGTTATTHQLGGTFRPLRADGTLGAPVTSVSLRNGEGAIFIRT